MAYAADQNQSKNAIAQVRDTVRELLGGKYSNEVCEKLSVLLAQGTWTHDYPITYDHAKELALHLNSEMPAPLLDLLALHPQPVRQQPAVEYLPRRRVPEKDQQQAA